MGLVADGSAIRVILARLHAHRSHAMTLYVGLDVSQKTTAICIVDETGHRTWRGECRTLPEEIAAVIRQHAGAEAAWPEIEKRRIETRGHDLDRAGIEREKPREGKSLAARTRRRKVTRECRIWVMCGRRPRCKGILAFGLRSGASHVSGLFVRRHDRWP